MLRLNTSPYFLTSQVSVTLASPRNSVRFAFSLRVGQICIPDVETQNVLRGEQREVVSGGHPPRLSEAPLGC